MITEKIKVGETIEALTLIEVLSFQKGLVNGISWSNDGKLLGVISDNKGFVFDPTNRNRTKVLKHIKLQCRTIEWSNDNSLLAIGIDNDIYITDAKGEKTIAHLQGHRKWINRLCFSPDNKFLLSTSGDGTMRIWDLDVSQNIQTFGPFKSVTNVILWQVDQNILILSTSTDLVFINFKYWEKIKTISVLPKGDGMDHIIDLDIYHNLVALCNQGSNNIYIWNIETHLCEIVIEGHTRTVIGLCFSKDGRILVSKSFDSTLKFWRTDTWEQVEEVEESCGHTTPMQLAFHPNKPILATRGDKDSDVRLWHIDIEKLLKKESPNEIVRYTTAKIVLVGDSGVGKTGLGWRISQNFFKEHESTHGQQFWVVNALEKKRLDGTECEAVIWDLAGQPDYRLVHSLFLDNINLALLLFDPTSRPDPLSGPLFWLNQIKNSKNETCKIVLVGSRVDRGMPTFTKEELETFCTRNSISGGFIPTSAKTGEGLDDLLDQIKAIISWDSLSATITSLSFKKIKEYVLLLKEDIERKEILISPESLKEELESCNIESSFSYDEMLAAVKNLENHGYISILTGSNGDLYILLYPDLLANLASSFVLEARRNQRGLGVLEERKILEGGYPFPELMSLKNFEKEILLDATIELFLQHAICFRENFNEQTFFVFPALINEKKPLSDDIKVNEDLSYRISGATENVYASLVVLLGYTNTFIRNNQWQNQAQYQMGENEVCGFRQVSNIAGEIELVLYYMPNVPQHVKTLFQGLFERFLSKKDLNISRYQTVECPKCKERLSRNVVIEQLKKKRNFSFCSNCGKKLNLPTPENLSIYNNTDVKILDQEEGIALRRTIFETALVKLKSIIKSVTRHNPKCFISYAWGNLEHEQWVLRLAQDLKKVEIEILFDRWNNPPGSSITRFIEKILDADFVILVGTSKLVEKYGTKDKDPIVAAELNLINTRIIRPNKFGAINVLPLLLEGNSDTSFTPLLHDLVYVNCLEEENYFYNLLTIVRQLYLIPMDNTAFSDLQELLNAKV